MGDPKSLVAVINTAKMATGSLSRHFLTSWDCKESQVNEGGLNIHGCTDNRTVLRSHKYDVALEGIRKWRTEYPNQKCLILTAVRSPSTWFQSQYIQRKGQCDASKMGLDDMKQDYKQYLMTFDVGKALNTALPQLLQEFGGGELQDQFTIMDQTGGYSVLGPLTNKNSEL